MSLKIGNGTAASAEMTVDTDGNAHVTLPTEHDQAGFGALISEVDAGAVLPARLMIPPEVSEDFRLRTGIDSLLFHLAFEGTNIARAHIQQNDTTATSAQTNGALTINSGASVTSGQGSHIVTYRMFPLYTSFMTYFEMEVAVANATATNAVGEFGAGIASGVTAQVTDGCFFRVASGGQLQAIIANASADISNTAITTTNIPPRDGAGSFDISETNHYTIGINNDIVHFWINDTLVAKVQTPAQFGAPTSASEQPLFGRVYNSGAASAGKQVIFRFVGVNQGDLAGNKPYGHQMCGTGGGAYQVQPGVASGPLVTRGASTTAGWPNSTQARGAGTWTATSAPATGSLGGQWVSPAISTLTSEADYPVFAYANPTGAFTRPGKTLYITGIKWGKTVAQAAASTNSIVLQYLVGVGGNSAVTNATEAAAVVAARGISLDLIPFKSTAVVGDYVEGGDIDFSEAPLVVPPGCYILFVVRPYGTVASNTLVVHGSVAFIGYHE